MVVPVPLRSRDVGAQLAYLDSCWNGVGLWSDGFSTAVVEPLDFDSKCFDLPMGRVYALMANGSCIGSGVIDKAKALGLRHLAVRLPSDDLEVVQDFISAGFYVTDTTTTFSIHGWNAVAIADEIGLVQEEEIPVVAQLSAAAFEKSRFFNDPNLSMEGGSKVFSQWAINDCRGRADVTFVARMDGAVVGFNSCLLTPDLTLPNTPAHATIDLIAVSPEAQGRGLGRHLVAACLAHYHGKAEEIFVGTQGSNRGAIRLYESGGFRFESLDLTLHWFDA